MQAVYLLSWTFISCVYLLRFNNYSRMFAGTEVASNPVSQICVLSIERTHVILSSKTASDRKRKIENKGRVKCFFIFWHLVTKDYIIWLIRFHRVLNQCFGAKFTRSMSRKATFPTVPKKFPNFILQNIGNKAYYMCGKLLLSSFNLNGYTSWLHVRSILYSTINTRYEWSHLMISSSEENFMTWSRIEELCVFQKAISLSPRLTLLPIYIWSCFRFIDLLWQELEVIRVLQQKINQVESPS